MLLRSIPRIMPILCLAVVTACTPAADSKKAGGKDASGVKSKKAKEKLDGDKTTKSEDDASKKFGHAMLYKKVTQKLHRCVNIQPSIQFIEENELRFEYIHGCGQDGKDQVAESMWAVLAKVAELAPEDLGRTVRVETTSDTGRAIKLFESETTPEQLASIRAGSLDLAAWKPTVTETTGSWDLSGPRASFVAALPEPKIKKKPSGDKLEGFLTSFVKILPCVKTVTRVQLSDPVEIDYTEGCDHTERDNVQTTMFRVAMRVIGQFRSRKMFGGVKITAETESGEKVVHTASAVVLEGIQRRKYGIVDWLAAEE